MSAYEPEIEEALKKYSLSSYALFEGRKHVANDFDLLKPDGAFTFYHRSEAENFQTVGKASDFVKKGDQYFKFNLLDDAVSMYSRSSWRYPSLMARCYFPPLDDVKWSDMYLGFEGGKGTVNGIASWRFFDDGGVQFITGPCPPRVGGDRKSGDVSGLLDYSVWNNTVEHYVKVNRASMEFWQGARLQGIVQFGLSQGYEGNNTTYDVRNAQPYFLKQLRGSVDRPLKTLIEFGSHSGAVGETTNFGISRYSAYPGDPAPPRSLEPWTGGNNWAGTSIDSGTLTSDRIPCAGYGDVTVYFKADTAGTLALNVDYGFDALDGYDSVSVSADSLKKYKPAHEIPWLQLEYTPDSYPATVTRANVVME